MPNWAFTYLTAPKHVLDFMRNTNAYPNGAKDEDKVNEFDLNNIIPMPEALENTTSLSRESDETLIKAYGHDNWYNWAIGNWGTKWNACRADRNEDGVYFETAWSPPEPAIRALSAKFPNDEIKVEFTEESDAFHVIIFYLNGEVIKELDFEWTLNTGCPNCEDGWGSITDQWLEGEDSDYIEVECDECGTVVRRTKFMEIITAKKEL